MQGIINSQVEINVTNAICLNPVGTCTLSSVTVAFAHENNKHLAWPSPVDRWSCPHIKSHWRLELSAVDRGSCPHCSPHGKLESSNWSQIKLRVLHVWGVRRCVRTHMHDRSVLTSSWLSLYKRKDACSLTRVSILWLSSAQCPVSRLIQPALCPLFLLLHAFL